MTDTKKKASDVYWFALVYGTMGEPFLISSKTQKELKKDLTSRGENLKLISVIKGKEFKVKVQRQFEFVTSEVSEDHKEQIHKSLTGHSSVDQLHADMGNA